MLDIIAKLLQVQERDQRLRNLQRDLKEVPNLQARAKDQLADDQNAVNAATAAMRDVEVKIKNVEIDVQTRQNTIKRLQDQQFETRKNDEFQALGNEVIRKLLSDRMVKWRTMAEAGLLKAGCAHYRHVTDAIFVSLDSVILRRAMGSGDVRERDICAHIANNV